MQLPYRALLLSSLEDFGQVYVSVVGEDNDGFWFSELSDLDFIPRGKCAVLPLGELDHVTYRFLGEWFVIKASSLVAYKPRPRVFIPRLSRRSASFVGNCA
jgi:hypothetical protein